MSLPLLLSSRLGIPTLTNEPPPTLAFTSFTSAECWRSTTLDGTDGATIGRLLAGCCHGAAKNRTARKGPSACLIHSGPCVCTSTRHRIPHPLIRRRRILKSSQPASQPKGPAARQDMTAELVQTLAEHGISSSMTTDEALVYRLLDSVAADGGLTPDAKKEVRGNKWGGAVRICTRCWREMDRLGGYVVERLQLV